MAQFGYDDLDLNIGNANSAVSNYVSPDRGNVSDWFQMVLHPFKTWKGVEQAHSRGIDTSGWSNADIIEYAKTGKLPYEVNSPVSGSSSPYASQDPSGYDQAQWDLDNTRALLAEARAYNSAEAEKQRAWQEEMSNSAYQRASQDLEAAGLNKWLAVTGGNGASASTPSGASASSQAGDVSTPSPQLAKQLIASIASIFSSAAKISGKK